MTYTFDINAAICRRDEYRATPTQPSLWDPVTRRAEPSKTRIQTESQRHQKARILCNNCPLLEPCEHYLTDMEQKGIKVPGIVAGRYSDLSGNLVNIDRIKRPSPRDTDRQSQCRGCQHIMWPSLTPPHRLKGHPDDVLHRGEGLCHDCWPTLSRTARKQRTKDQKKLHHNNNAYH